MNKPKEKSHLHTEKNLEWIRTRWYDLGYKEGVFHSSLVWCLIMGLLVALLSGCMTTRNVPVEERSATYNQGKEEVFKAVKSTLVKEGYTIREISYKSGIINTEPKHDAFKKSIQAVVTEKGSGKTELVITLDYSYATQYGYSNTMYGGVEGGFYNQWFNKIEKRL